MRFDSWYFMFFYKNNFFKQLEMNEKSHVYGVNLWKSFSSKMHLHKIQFKKKCKISH